MRPREYLIKCNCNNCGTSLDVFYDTLKDFYICSDCLDREKEDEPEQEEDSYPLDMNYNELAKWRNT